MAKAKSSSLRWLIVVPELPRFDHAGGDRRLLEILKIVAVDCELFLLPVRPMREGDAEYEQRLRDSGIRVIGRGVKDGINALVLHRFDAVFFEFYHTIDRLLRVAREVQPHALVIVDSVDLHFLREREAVKLGAHDAAIAAETELDELNAYRKADIVVAVSHSECAVLQEMGFSSVEVIPIIVPIVERVRRERLPELLFIGGFNHRPNEFGVLWFHRHVWPRVRQRVPDARWNIAGSSATPPVRALHDTDGIEVLGFVPSTEPLLDSAQVSIAPLTFGGGMKGKVSEALAAGVPVVTTTWGAQGLEEGRDTAFLVEDDPEKFADAVVLLLGNAAERERLTQRGQLLAAKLCSASASAPVVAALVRRSQRPETGSLLRRLALFAAFLARRAMARVRA